MQEVIKIPQISPKVDSEETTLDSTREETNISKIEPGKGKGIKKVFKFPKLNFEKKNTKVKFYNRRYN